MVPTIAAVTAIDNPRDRLRRIRRALLRPLDPKSLLGMIRPPISFPILPSNREQHFAASARDQRVRARGGKGITT
jgi:hypothetical protein